MKSNIYIRIMLVLLTLVTVFHLSIMVKLIPYNIAWGGRLTNDTEMYTFESISIFINLFLILVLLIKGNYLKLKWNGKIINVILWVFFVIFILNTLGNIVAKTNFEKVFAALTFISAILIWNILKNKSEKTVD